MHEGKWLVKDGVNLEVHCWDMGCLRMQRGMGTSALNQCHLLSSSSPASLDKRDKAIQCPKGPSHEPRFAPPLPPGPHVGLNPHCFTLFSAPSPTLSLSLSHGPSLPPPSKLRLSSLYGTHKEPYRYRIISCPYPLPNNTDTKEHNSSI
ncbi:unnamed protein product [Sphenostylis stenocarpa]|uniref:Uncharacterized protein n=1 Tax=Sphenostylis stenocarpa TaxID=92480 RepID=A0AA86VVT7_9FABA|nr:unnamed protein product [Sphenostylis stenocarpa]